MKLRMYLRGLGIGIAVTAVIMSFTVRTKKNKMSDAEVIARATELGMVMEDNTLKGGLSDDRTETEQPDSNIETGTVIEDNSEANEINEDSGSSDSSENSEEGTEESDNTNNNEELKEDSKSEKTNAEDTNKDKTKEDLKTEETKTEDTNKEKTKEDLKTEETKTEDTNKEKIKEDKKLEETKVKDTKESSKTEDKTEKDQNKENQEIINRKGQFKLNIAGGVSSYAVCTLLEKGGVIKSASEFDKYICSKGYDRRITTGEHIIPEDADYETIAKILVNEN